MINPMMYEMTDSTSGAAAFDATSCAARALRVAAALTH
jgi:hypothetical protein